MPIGTDMIIQVIGWIASLTAIASYSFSDVRRIRVINCVAAMFFIVYGAMISAPAVVVMNASLAAVHIAYLVGKDRFASFVDKRRALVWSAFAVYAAASVVWVAISTSFNAAEIVGILSSVGFVGGFLMAKEKPMRVTCSVALIANIVYAIMIASPQIALTNSVSLAVNLYRLLQTRQKQMAARN